MKLFIGVLVICFGISTVLSSLDKQNDKHHQINQKSHVRHEKEKNHHAHGKNHDLRQHHNHHVHDKAHHKPSKSRTHSSEHHYHQTAARSHYHHGPTLTSAYRSKQHEQCSWVCNDLNKPVDTGLEVTLKSSKSVFSILSKSSQDAIVLDYKASIAILLSGSKGTSYVSDLQNGSFFQLQHSDLNWNSSTSNLKEYLQKISAPEVFNAAKSSGQKLDINNLTGTASPELQTFLNSFGVSSPPHQFLNFLLTFSRNISGVLASLFHEDVTFSLPNNLEWFLKVTENIAYLRNFGLDITPLNSDCRSIFSRGSGIDVLINILSRLGRTNDLSGFISNITNSRETALGTLKNISCGSHDGLDGLITVLVNVIEVSEGKGSVSDIISSVLKLNTTSLNNVTLGEVIHKAIEAAEAQSRNYPHNEAIDRLLTFLRNLDHGTLIVNNIHIIDLIKLLLSPNPIDKVRSIFHIISNFSPSQGIPEFFKFVTGALNNTGNCSILSQLVPGLNISQFTNGNGTILQNILQGRNLTELLSNGQNIQSVFSHIPILGPIVHQVSSAVGGDNLSKFFNTNGFQQIFSHGFGDIFKNFGNLQSGNPLSAIVDGIEKNFGNVVSPGNSTTQVPSTESGSTESIASDKASTILETTENDNSTPTETTENSTPPGTETTENGTPSSTTGTQKVDPPNILADPIAGGIPNLFGLRGDLDVNFGLEGRNAHRYRLKRNSKATA